VYLGEGIEGGYFLFKHNHVTVMVSDLNRSIQFYIETLGLRPGKSESLSIGFEVENLEPAIDTLKSHGVIDKMGR
jgi:catechol 2,3-dioxygenase-like lactoylglutathione lyase family enzyme